MKAAYYERKGDARAAGALKARISSRFPLDEIAAEAHELVGTAGAGGKVLVDIP